MPNKAISPIPAINSAGQPIQRWVDEQICELEESSPVFDYQVDGWCIWSLLRFSIYSELANLPRDTQSGHTPFPYAQRLAWALEDFSRIPFLSEVKISALVQSSNLAEEQDGKYQDIYFDELLGKSGSFVKIENVLQRHYLPRRKDALLPSKITLNYLHILLGITTRLPAPNEFDRISQELSRIIIDGLHLPAFTPERIRRRLVHFYRAKPLAQLVLKRLNPRYLWLTTAYMYSDLVAAARELGIQVIEFQHGLVNRYHGGYSWTPAALPYKNKLPIPDQIFLYGTYWQAELAHKGFWQEELISVGSTRIDRYRNYSNLPAGDLNTILVTTQNIDNSKIIDFFVQLLKLSDPNRKFKIIFKLHPGEGNAGHFKSAFANYPQVEIYLNSEGSSTLELLNQADFHVSIYSTCHYEALALGVPTVILPFTNHQTVLHLVDSGYAVLVHNPEELLTIINRRKKIAVPAEIGDQFFRPKAVDYMLQQLSTIDQKWESLWTG